MKFTDDDPDRCYPVSLAMRTRIAQALDAIEADEGVRIVFACESGSRGWGFASPDSDYDVRFIYVRPLDDYLRVAPRRDVIERPLTDELDVGGWELRKTLALLIKGNATPVEWLASPIVYRADARFVDDMRAATATVFQPDRSLRHYLHMADGNFREYLKGERVRLKKYLYVLRPLLAAGWIAAGRGVPPMAFPVLADAMIDDTALRHAVAELLAYKRRAGEAEEGPAVPVIHAFIAAELDRLAALAPTPPTLDDRCLDQLLADTVKRLDMGLPLS